MATHPLKQIDFNQSNNAYVIEASAGTGKTWTIERLFIKALLESSRLDNTIIGIENILVVTFTNDATNELKDRISSQIKATIDQIVYIHNEVATESDIFSTYLETRKDLYIRDLTILNRALQNFDWASIYTIHGFCKKILNDYPFECLINPEFELVNDKTEVLESLVLNFMRSEIINRFTNDIDVVLTNLEKIFTSSDITKTLVGRITSKIPCDILTIKNATYVNKYNIGITPNLSKLADPQLDSEILPLVKAEFLASVINYIINNYIQNNKLSFDELIERISDRLFNSKILSDKIFSLYPVAFIDEFQDTDKLQWEIFSSIYHLDRVGRGNVVVVGDPKQAIYSFRGADIDTYIKARHQITNKLSLDSNFRSNYNIINFINELFVADGVLGDGIKYSPSIAKTNTGNTLPELEEVTLNASNRGVKANFYNENVQIVIINGTTKPLRTNSLFKAMTFEILSLLNTDKTLGGKIAILVNRNQECTEVVEYLRIYGIAASELKLGNIFATNTANDLFLFLNSIFDLSIRKNFIKAITSRLFNFDLSNLVNFNDNKEIQILLQDFYYYQQTWSTKGVISLIYTLFNNLFKNDTYSINNRELSNIWQLAELLNRSSATSQTELLFWFHQKIINASKVTNIDGQNEELVRLDNDNEQILVTTQHKSKGLEFDIVFCPFFKSNKALDKKHLPFFSSYSYDGIFNSSMVTDETLGSYIVNKDNKESQRLNYVALTRAKTRIYIYLKQPTILKSGKYSTSEKPDKITELFGYVKDKPDDLSHPLFNYPKFFSNNPQDGFKKPLNGVIAYNRDLISDNDLKLLHFIDNAAKSKKTNLIDVKINPTPVFYRQSYTLLTKTNEPSKYSDNDDTNNPIAELEYRYSILSDKECRGPTFGVLFHHLCENYPFTHDKLKSILIKYNIDNEIYHNELTKMLDEAFSYHILDNLGISDFTNSMHELEFNLSIKNTITICADIYLLMCNYFGEKHPFTLACRSLGTIEEGFLVGFIDLLFEHNGLYFVLDYKTNTLTDYTSTSDINDVDNPLIISMAEHHYYLQYLLYLVAVKRYLEQRLKIEDASHLLGGAAYYYVRGIYTAITPQGVFIDKNCQHLVSELDKLFYPIQI